MNKPVIKWTIFLLILWGMPLLSACVYVPPLWDAFDTIQRVDSITPGITTKEEVLHKFGEPDSQYPYNKPVFYTYIGYKSNGALLPLFGKGDPVLVGETKWHIAIRFDENDVVSSVSTSDNIDPVWLRAQEASTYCPNADHGYADVQFHIGELLYDGVILEKDPARAWVWYSLSLNNGYIRAEEQLLLVTAELSPELLAQAKQQLESWKPGQCVHDLFPHQNE